MESKRKNTEVSDGAGTSTTTNVSTVTRSTAQYITITSPPQKKIHTRRTMITFCDFGFF